MQEFKNGKVSILVATDVAARGLDVKDIGKYFIHKFIRLCDKLRFSHINF
jgi:hypothetical protein